MKLIAPEIKNMPWQEQEKKPENAPVWRYRDNPVVGRNPIKGVSRIFNSAVVPFEDGFIGVFRGEQKGQAWKRGIPWLRKSARSRLVRRKAILHTGSVRIAANFSMMRQGWMRLQIRQKPFCLRRRIIHGMAA